MATYSIRHITRYSYPAPVTDSANQVMLFPVTDDHQELKEYKLVVTHQPPVEIFTDYFGNKVGLFSVTRPHQELLIQADMNVVTHPVPLPADDKPAAEQWADLEAGKEQLPAIDFLILEKSGIEEEVTELIAGLIHNELTPFQTAEAMSSYIYSHFAYQKGITSVETKVDEIWKLKAGVCQDFAHLLLYMLRNTGIPARYVSGYICPKNHELRGEGATHAWVEAWIPFHGWIGLDPTNNCVAGDRHVRLAMGRDFSDCTPVKGTYKGSSRHSLEVLVVIDNNVLQQKELFTPVFTYKSEQNTEPDNSYRRFMEMQQQQ